jgi:hypothetical protein
MTQRELLLAALLVLGLIGWGITAYAFNLLAREHNHLVRVHNNLQGRIHAGDLVEIREAKPHDPKKTALSKPT